MISYTYKHSSAYHLTKIDNIFTAPCLSQYPQLPTPPPRQPLFLLCLVPVTQPNICETDHILSCIISLFHFITVLYE